MKRKFVYLSLLIILTQIICQKSVAQISNDSTVCLKRMVSDKTTPYDIPLTKFCFVMDAGMKSNRNLGAGWVMSQDIVKKKNSNLLFLEMNSTDVAGWTGNKYIDGSVQLVVELPAFSDSIHLKELSYKAKGVYVINNYGGIERKKEFLNGEIKLVRKSGNLFISSAITLLTKNPQTEQWITLGKKSIPSLTFDQYQELESIVAAIRKAEYDALVSSLTETIIFRDSIRRVESQRIKDSLQNHPYKGEFRFWISDVHKAEYSRITYCFTGDSIIIKKGPYDFIYLAKNYSKDVVSFKKRLRKADKKLILKIQERVEHDSLNKSYHNICIMGGLILSFSFESADFSKDMTVSNYYNETIAYVINLVNSMLPRKYRLWYDKQLLLKMQADCAR